MKLELKWNEIRIKMKWNLNLNEMKFEFEFKWLYKVIKSFHKLVLWIIE